MPKSLSRMPAQQPEMPSPVRERLGSAAQCVWLNEAGGTTWSAAGRFLKWNPVGSIESLGDEFIRLRWLEGRFPAPLPVEFAEEGDGELLVTEALPGSGAVTPSWLERPADAVRAIASGLRALHALDPADCPFLSAAPAGHDDDQVVLHGDSCAPNTIIADDGSFAGIVDVGRLGVGDRWLDLVIAARSLGWNFGPGYEPLFFDTYGIEPDAERTQRWLAWHDAAD